MGTPMTLRHAIAPDRPPAFMTRWYQLMLDAFRALPGYVSDPRDADVLIPSFDTAYETNWPHYGEPERALLHGSLASYVSTTLAELRALLESTRQPVLVVDMNPFSGMPRLLREEPRIVIAAGSAPRDELRPGWDFGFPAAPIVAAPAPVSGPRPLFASFRGGESHPVRARLAPLDNGHDVLVQCIAGTPGERARREFSESYLQLAARSVFSFVPRGDAHFSYRLLEVMSAGSIPVILSDGWELPFTGLVDWPGCAVVLPEAEAGNAVGHLRALPSAAVSRLADRVRAEYWGRLATPALQAEAALALLERRLLRPAGLSADRGSLHA
jgi:hypothetical protein